MDDRRRGGAIEAIPGDFETSLEIFAHVLRRLRLPRNVSALQVDLVRQQAYSMRRGLQVPRQTLDQLGDILAATTTESLIAPHASATGGRDSSVVTRDSAERNVSRFTNARKRARPPKSRVTSHHSPLESQHA